MNFDSSEPFERNHLNIIAELAKGQYGRIYNATYKNHPVVVRSSLQYKIQKEMLVREHQVLQYLQPSNITGIPKVSFSFQSEGKECLIMEKLDTDLTTFLNFTSEGKLFLDETLKVALQVLNILRSIHSRGFIHSDIKRRSFMIKTTFEKDTIYLIDFGFASRYLTTGGQHIKDEGTKMFRSNYKYCSIHSMQVMNYKFRSQSRRDDLESLAYLLVQLRTGKLPWDDILNRSDLVEQEKREKIIVSKSQPAERICEGMRDEFVKFLRGVRSLKFDEEPHYDEYYSMFDKLLKDINPAKMYN